MSVESLADWSLDVALRTIATELPDRWKHTEGALVQARTFAPVLGDDLDLLLAAVVVHDIGFTTPAYRTGFQTLDGALHLRSLGAPARLVDLQAHLVCGRGEAGMRGLENHYGGFGVDERSPVRDALWTACLTATPDGAETTARDKFADWRVRYAHLDYLIHYLDSCEPELLAAERRTRERLTGDGR